MIISNELKTFLTHLTQAPGIYRMLDATGQVLYVGKASNLKKRVQSYFRQEQSTKTQSLVSQIASIDIQVTRSETEALLLESNLIKSLRPKYNVLMRDDKTYPFIHISSKHSFPRIEVLRRKQKPQDGDFFGPYPNATAVRQTLALIQKIFKIRNCTDSYFNARTRPCLQFQIKRCSAPCTQYISGPDYLKALQDARRFLQGKSQQILQELELRMQAAVKALAFEEAALLRDQIKHLRLVQEQQSMVQLRGDADVIVIEAQPGFACIQWVSIRDGQVLASDRFFPSVPTLNITDETEPLWQQVFTAFINHFYLSMPERIPGLILTNHQLDDHQALEALLTSLRQKECHIQTRSRGTKARWIDFARDNLQQAIKEQNTSMALMKTRYEALCQFLQLNSPIKRMACFDISHTQGQDTIASCVVFDEKGPCKRAYRRFNIKGITPGDDYAAMEQAIIRYFKHLGPEGLLPDLLIIDGGKGQVAATLKALQVVNRPTMMILGIAKGPERKAGMERLILANAQHEQILPSDSPALHLLQQIRDEAHRFAITAHRQKRQKSSMSSTLELIDGVGPKRRQALLQRFGGLRELSKASVAEIVKVSGISQDLAQRIHQHFHME